MLPKAPLFAYSKSTALTELSGTGKGTGSYNPHAEHPPHAPESSHWNLRDNEKGSEEQEARHPPFHCFRSYAT